MAPLSTYTSTRTKAWWSSKGLDGGFGHLLSGVGAVVDGSGLGEDVESEIVATFGPFAVLLGSLQAQPIRLPARRTAAVPSVWEYRQAWTVKGYHHFSP